MSGVDSSQSIIAIVPAAGVGSRMQAECPKQYLKLKGKTILEHTVNKLLSHPAITQVVIAINPNDTYFSQLEIANNPRVTVVTGGDERAHSVLSALRYIVKNKPCEWVMVHDAARPCVKLNDIHKLIEAVEHHPIGGILAAPVRDTIKRSDTTLAIEHTVERTLLWHALTPQMFRTQMLFDAISSALTQHKLITDEASAMELLGLRPLLVPSHLCNLKITEPDDLLLAEFYLNRVTQ